MCKEIALDVEEFCAIDQACDFRRRQVGLFELLCGAQSGDEGPGARSADVKLTPRVGVTLPVMTSDDDCTRSRLLTALDEVDLCKTLFFVCLPELLGELVIADAASIHDGIGGKYILRCVRKWDGVKEIMLIRQHRGQHSVQHHRRRRRLCVHSRSHRIYFL